MKRKFYNTKILIMLKIAVAFLLAASNLSFVYKVKGIQANEFIEKSVQHINNGDVVSLSSRSDWINILKKNNGRIIEEKNWHYTDSIFGEEDNKYTYSGMNGTQRGIDCARFVCYSLFEYFGDMNPSTKKYDFTMAFYGAWNGSASNPFGYLHYHNNTKYIQKVMGTMDVIYYYRIHDNQRLTPYELRDVLEPGDIVLYANPGHTNVYAGMNSEGIMTWYNIGHIMDTNNDGYFESAFLETNDIGNPDVSINDTDAAKKYKNRYVSYILRLKYNQKVTVNYNKLNDNTNGSEINYIPSQEQAEWQTIKSKDNVKIVETDKSKHYAYVRNNSYTIKYNLNGGKLEKGYNQTYTSKNGQTYQLNPTKATFNGTKGFTNKWISINNPVRKGYTFEGWTISGYNKDTAYSYKTGSEIDSPKVSTLKQGKIKRQLFKNLTPINNETITFTANWKAIKYNLAYNLDGGELKDGLDQTYTSNNGQTYQLNPTYAEYNGTSEFTNKWIRLHHPVKEGYDFVGWTISGYDKDTAYSYRVRNETDNPKLSSLEQGKIKRQFYKNLAINNNQTVTFKANWNLATYDIEYDLDGGILVDGYNQTYTSKNGQTYQLNPTQATFNGTKGFTNKWIRINYPVKEGYTFEGWKISGYCENTAYSYRSSNETDNPKVSSLEQGNIKKMLYKNLASNSNQKVTFIACWKPITFDITYDLDGGEMDIYPDSYSSADTFELPIPTKEGYTFVGWYSDSEFTEEINEIVSGRTGDLKLFAKWEALDIDDE